MCKSVPQVSYASLVTRGVAAPVQNVVVGAVATSPGMPVFVLRQEWFCRSELHLSGRRITYTLASGGGGVISTDEIDWEHHDAVNSGRGVRVTLRGGHPSQGASGNRSLNVR